MSELFFIILVIIVIVALIFFVYNLMLSSEKPRHEEDLQITSHDILEQVSILYKQRKYNIVETLAKKYLEKKPSDYGVRSILAKSFYEMGRKYEALEHAHYVCNHQPKNFPMRIFVANCYNDNGKPMQAISVLTDLLNEDANNVVAIKDLAHLYLETNQKKSAIKMLKRLDEFIYSNQEKVNNKNVIARLHMEFREYDEAIEQYQEILQIYPADVLVKKSLVEAYKMNSDYESAIELTEEILSLNINEEANIWATKLLIDLYSVINDYEKALMYANLYKDNPNANKEKATESIAKILMETGQIEESIDVLKNLVENN
ncbi:MAG TPA: tetratricopeptide repeat protein, partial [Candidatus Gastranaerophilaceae bacterium]|nr:tetratricopeptide repeat protein [Candidatus Gastranaerophilaceae bacterium]